MKKKKITMNDLAKMIQKGFRETAKGFDRINGRFDGIDKRFDRIDKRFDKIERILLDHKTRIEKLEGGMKELKEILSL